MKRPHLLVCIGTLCILTNSNASDSGSPGSVGPLIAHDSTQASFGTAFCALDTTTLITCAHVIQSSTNEFLYICATTPTNPQPVVVVFSVAFPGHDVALLRAKQKIADRPFRLGDLAKVRPGDWVTYIAIDYEKLAFDRQTCQVGAVGNALAGPSNIVQFIDFPGPIKPGYSGGPVLNSDGEVVGLIVCTWQQKPTKDSPKFKSTVLTQLIFSRHSTTTCSSPPAPPNSHLDQPLSKKCLS